MHATAISNIHERRRKVIAALVAGTPSLHSVFAQTVSDDVARLAGVWTGELEHGGDRTPIYVVLAPGRDGAFVAKLSLPVLDLYDVGLGKATLNGGTLRFASLSFDYDAAGDRLSGTLPTDLVPVYALKTTLTRTKELVRRPRPDFDAPLRDPAWTSAVGASVWSDVAAAHGLVFIGADDGRLHALDARSGAQHWIYTADGPFRSGSTVAGERLYVTSDDGVLHCLGARDAKVLWRIRVNRDRAVRLPATDPKSKYDVHGAAVRLVRDTVFVGTHEGRVLALEAGDGRPRWTFSTGDRIVATPFFADGQVLVGSFDGKVYALDAATGVLRWAFNAKAPVTSTPTRVGDVVVVGSRAYDIWGLDAATGRPRWNHYVWFSWIESSPAIAGRAAYVGSSDAAKIFAFDAVTGRSHWTTDVHGFAWGAPVVDGDRLFIGTRSEPGPIAHRANAMALDRTTGNVLWRHPVEAGGANTPRGFAGGAAVAQGRVVLAAVDGRVFAFDTR